MFNSSITVLKAVHILKSVIIIINKQLIHNYIIILTFGGSVTSHNGAKSEVISSEPMAVIRINLCFKTCINHSYIITVSCLL